MINRKHSGSIDTTNLYDSNAGEELFVPNRIGTITVPCFGDSYQAIKDLQDYIDKLEKELQTIKNPG